MAPEQSTSPAQARQTFASHLGVLPEQSPSPRHCTQVAVATEQMGTEPTQAMVFVPEHSPHAPEA